MNMLQTSKARIVRHASDLASRRNGRFVRCDLVGGARSADLHHAVLSSSALLLVSNRRLWAIICTVRRRTLHTTPSRSRQETTKPPMSISHHEKPKMAEFGKAW